LRTDHSRNIVLLDFIILLLVEIWGSNSKGHSAQDAVSLDQRVKQDSSNVSEEHQEEEIR